MSVAALLAFHAVVGSVHSMATGAALTATSGGQTDALLVETDHVLLAIGDDGTCTRFVDKRTGTNYCKENSTKENF